MRFVDRRKLVTLHVAEGWRRLRLAAAVSRPTSLSSASFRITRVIVAPTDLRAVDPFVAEEILNGRFPLAGRVLDVGA